MSMRVKAPLPAGDIRRSRGEVQEDPYMNRLVKLVPAEAVGPYPFLMDYADKLTPYDGVGPRYAVYFVAWVLLAIVLIVRWKTTSEPGKGAQWGSILIAGVAFFIWVHVMKGDFGFELLLPQATASRGEFGALVTSANDYKQFFFNVLLMVWTTLAPVVYRGDESPG